MQNGIAPSGSLADQLRRHTQHTPSPDAFAATPPINRTDRIGRNALHNENLMQSVFLRTQKACRQPKPNTPPAAAPSRPTINAHCPGHKKITPIVAAMHQPPTAAHPKPLSTYPHHPNPQRTSNDSRKRKMRLTAPIRSCEAHTLLSVKRQSAAMPRKAIRFASNTAVRVVPSDRSNCAHIAYRLVECAVVSGACSVSTSRYTA